MGSRSCRGHVLLLLPRRKCRYLACALCTTVEFEVPPWPVGVISVVLFLLLLQFARKADDPWYIAYQDESTQWCSQRMDLEEKVANLGDELARKNLMIFELKRTVEEEKKNSELIRKEKLILETDLAVFDQVVENLEHELQVMGEEKSRFIWAVLLGVIPVLAVMWLW